MTVIVPFAKAGHSPLTAGMVGDLDEAEGGAPEPATGVTLPPAPLTGSTFEPPAPAAPAEPAPASGDVAVLAGGVVPLAGGVVVPAGGVVVLAGGDVVADEPAAGGDAPDTPSA